MEKTNVMRQCDALGVLYDVSEYKVDDGAIDGIAVADKLNKSHDEVFKTLVTIGQSKTYYVFMVPVSGELNLKKAAEVTGEKFIEMIPVKDILKITGYIKGGCSPIGMKKQFKTIIDETLILLDEITFSAGKIGYQITIKTDLLSQVLEFEVFDLLK